MTVTVCVTGKESENPLHLKKTTVDPPAVSDKDADVATP